VRERAIEPSPVDQQGETEQDDGAGSAQPPDAPAVQPDPAAYVDDRLGFVKGVTVGLAIGIVGTLGVQFGIHEFGKIHLGQDPLKYVTTISTTIPTYGHDDAIAARLDRVTGTKWRLRGYYQGKASGPQSLPAQREALGKFLTLPDQTRYPLQRLFTNAPRPAARRPDGTIFVLWFKNPFTARDWLIRGPDHITGVPPGTATTTLWAGDIVVYYAPGTENVSQSLKTWLAQAERCPTTASDC
jgi:hypothetical protein